MSTINKIIGFLYSRRKSRDGMTLLDIYRGADVPIIKVEYYCKHLLDTGKIYNTDRWKTRFRISDKGIKWFEERNQK